MISILSMKKSFLGKDGCAFKRGLDRVQIPLLEALLKHFLWQNKWELYYVDLFAGPGLCKIRETQKEINGSPLIALLENDFDKYYFLKQIPIASKL